jgi:hypothetical protein
LTFSGIFVRLQDFACVWLGQDTLVAGTWRTAACHILPRSNKKTREQSLLIILTPGALKQQFLTMCLCQQSNGNGIDKVTCMVQSDVSQT